MNNSSSSLLHLFAGFAVIGIILGALALAIATNG